jgi:hypothetical protein
MTKLPLFIRLDLATPDQVEDLAREVRDVVARPGYAEHLIGYEPGGISPRQFGALVHAGGNCAEAFKHYTLGPIAARIVADTQSGHGRLRLFRLEPSLVDILLRAPSESTYGLDPAAFHREVRSGTPD